MKHRYLILQLACLCNILFVAPVAAEERHNAIDSKYFVSLTDFFASRVFEAKANGSVTPAVPVQYVDFESDLNLADSPEMFVAEFRWQFGQKWNLGLQYFSSTRSGRKVLEETIEWNDLVYEVGVDVFAKTEIDITRIVLSRIFIQSDGHDLRLAAGLHWLDVGAELRGEATLDDDSTAFTTSRNSVSLPIPNIGAAYQYSPSAKWLFGLRADWFSATVGDYSGGIWNVMANANYQIGEKFGLGVGYQFFQLDGALKEEKWRGDLRVQFDGPFIQITGFWN